MAMGKTKLNTTILAITPLLMIVGVMLRCSDYFSRSQIPTESLTPRTGVVTNLWRKRIRLGRSVQETSDDCYIIVARTLPFVSLLHCSWSSPSSSVGIGKKSELNSSSQRPIHMCITTLSCANRAE